MVCGSRNTTAHDTVLLTSGDTVHSAEALGVTWCVPVTLYINLCLKQDDSVYRNNSRRRCCGSFRSQRTLKGSYVYVCPAQESKVTVKSQSMNVSEVNVLNTNNTTVFTKVSLMSRV